MIVFKKFFRRFAVINFENEMTRHLFSIQIVLVHGLHEITFSVCDTPTRQRADAVLEMLTKTTIRAALALLHPDAKLPDAVAMDYAEWQLVMVRWPALAEQPIVTVLDRYKPQSF